MTDPTTPQDVRVEEGRPGRLCVIRLKPNQDLCQGVAAACRRQGITRAHVRSGIGSLNEAHFEAGGRHVVVQGPGLEILTLTGEVTPGTAGTLEVKLAGSVCDQTGEVKGGLFRPDRNIICITLELLLQEWLPLPEP